MRERPEPQLRYGVPADPATRDSVDELLRQWAQEAPELDFTPIGVVTRLARVRTYLDAQINALFAGYGLTAADFLVIITLRRSGSPYTMPQARLMDALGLTSGTVSVRLDRLERGGIVARQPDPSSGRGSLVQLTAQGLRLFEEIAPAHLANEERLLSALTGDEQHQLAGLLRHLLAAYESSTHSTSDLGLVLEPAHLARGRRIAAGLSDTPGLLVAEAHPGGAGALAGLHRGDLITAVARMPVTSVLRLNQVLAARPAADVPIDFLRGNRTRTATLHLSTATSSS